MIGRDFWYDVLRSGAILGVAMAVSHILEQYLLLYSSLSLASVSVWYSLEWLLAAILFVWLLVRFSKRRASAADPKYGYSYSLALSYILMVSMLTGIIVGAANTIFIGAMGYGDYVEGMVGRVEEIRDLYHSMNIATLDANFNAFIEALRAAEQPTMLSNVFTSFNNYILTGGLPGLIIAGVVSRKPQLFNTEDKNNE